MQVSDSMNSRVYTLAEDVANGILQGIGILLSIIGLTILVAFATLRGGALMITASAVFGAALIILYTVSTVYHAIPMRVAPAFLARLDHIAIFVLIAGTYTPFALLALGGAVGWWLFAGIWALALRGQCSNSRHLRHRRGLAVTLYLVMGWLGMITFAPLSAALGTGGTACCWPVARPIPWACRSICGGGCRFTSCSGMPLCWPAACCTSLPYCSTWWPESVCSAPVAPMEHLSLARVQVVE